jgi:hypothetical protein
MENMNLYIAGFLLLVITIFLVYWFVIRSDDDEPQPTPSSTPGDTIFGGQPFSFTTTTTPPTHESFTDIAPCERTSYYKTTGLTPSPTGRALTDQECTDKYSSNLNTVYAVNCGDPNINSKEYRRENSGQRCPGQYTHHLYMSDDMINYARSDTGISELKAIFEQIIDDESPEEKQDFFNSMKRYQPNLPSLEYLTDEANFREFIDTAIDSNNKFFITDKHGNKIEQITHTNISNLKANIGHEYKRDSGEYRGDHIKMADGIVTECGAKFELPTGQYGVNECKLVYNIAPVELE